MWRLKIGLYLVGILFGFQAAFLVGARMIYTDEPNDPLIGFDTIRPGRVIDENLQLDWCVDYQEYYQQYAPEDVMRICYITSNTEIVQSVRIYVLYGTIQRLTYDLEGLTLGDLIVLWGYPVTDLEVSAHYPYLTWDKGEYIVSVSLGSRAFSYWLPIDTLIVHDTQESLES